MTTSYRADLDGVRAVAVLLVVFYHSGFGWVSGGFIGVDVFFVLTGFLITSLVVKALDEGSFSFREFYLRRVRRILPALLVVLTATLVAGFQLLQPSDLLALVDSTRYVLLSAGNLYFWLNTGGYFDADLHDMPLLHTWSLGVEEQFYLLWPALLVAAQRWLPKRLFTPLLGALVVAGLALSQWLALAYPSPAYYLLPGRAFEILLGALLAISKPRLPAAWPWLSSVLGLLGLSAILVCGFVLTAESTFPGLNAAWPCLGTALIIVAGNASGRAGLANRLLGLRPFVLLGLISYSVYLWHWPIIAFLNYKGTALLAGVRWLVVAASLALAAASYFLVEQPFRHRWRFSLPASLFGFAVVPALLGFSAHALTRRNDGFPSRFPASIEDDRPDKASNDAECPYDLNLKRMPRCVAGIQADHIDGLIAGDSYATMYVPFMDVLARDAELSLRHLGFRLTPPIPGVSIGPKPNRAQLAFVNGRQRLLEQQKMSVLISSWGGYGLGNKTNHLWDSRGRDVSAQADQRILDGIGKIVERGGKVVLVDRPRAAPGAARMKEIREQVAKGEPLDRFRVPIAPRSEDYLPDRVAKLYPTVLILRPWEAICDDTSCAVSIGETVLYSMDGSHMSSDGSRALGKKYLAERGNPLRQNRQP